MRRTLLGIAATAAAVVLTAAFVAAQGTATDQQAGGAVTIASISATCLR